MHHRLVEIKKQIGKFIANFSVTAEDGKEYIFDGDIIREGLEISTYNENGDVVPLEDGEYTIKGVKVNIVDGKVAKMPENTPANAPQTQNANEGEQQPTIEEMNDLRAERDRLKAENETMRAELEELKKKPLATPVPQTTQKTGKDETPETIKGSRFEKAYRVFGSK